MSYVRAAGNLIIDKPNADGRVTTWGIGRDWQAAEPRDKSGGGKYAADLAGSFGWQYGLQFEYLEKLRGIAPIGTYTEADMDLDGWTVTQGMWQESSTAGAMKKKHLHFYDARPARVAANAWGIVQSNASYHPNFEVHLWRFPADENETDPNIVSLVLTGNGSAPEYALVLPAGQTSTSPFSATTGTYKHPQLWGRPQGSAVWSLIDEHKGSGVVNVPGQRADWQAVRVEYTAGWLLVRFSGSEEAWAYSGPWRDAGGTAHNFALTTGPLLVEVLGHTAMFNVGELTYPASATLYPSATLLVGPQVNPTPSYRLIRSLDSGAGMTVAARTWGGGTQPAVTFTSDTHGRGVLYNVQEYRTPTIGDASSSAVESKANADFALTALSGELNAKWRGARLDATIKARAGKTLPTIYANAKIAAEVTLEATGGTYTKLFTGYHTPRERILEVGALGKVECNVTAADWIESRARHKVLYWHCSYEGWPVDDAFRHILNRCGVPDSLISIHADVDAEHLGAFYYLPIPNPAGDRGLQFRPDENVVGALDKIAGTRGLRWGVNQNGEVFLSPQYAHVAGHYDWTVDDSTQTAADFRAFRHVRGADDYFNVLAALVGEGWNSAGRLYADMASMETPGAAGYVGDDWWRFEGNPEADNLDLAMNRLWDTRGDGADLIYVKLQDQPTLLPDQELRVRVTGFEVTQNSIYRIIRKSWRLGDPNGTARFEQELEAVLVEEGTPDA